MCEMIRWRIVSCYHVVGVFCKRYWLGWSLVTQHPGTQAGARSAGWIPTNLPFTPYA